MDLLPPSVTSETAIRIPEDRRFHGPRRPQLSQILTISNQQTTHLASLDLAVDSLQGRAARVPRTQIRTVCQPHAPTVSLKPRRYGDETLKDILCATHVACSSSFTAWFVLC